MCPSTWQYINLLLNTKANLYRCMQIEKCKDENPPYSGTWPVPRFNNSRTLLPPDLISSIALACVMSLVLSPLISIIWSPTCQVRRTSSQTELQENEHFRKRHIQWITDYLNDRQTHQGKFVPVCLRDITGGLNNLRDGFWMGRIKCCSSSAEISVTCL